MHTSAWIRVLVGYGLRGRVVRGWAAVLLAAPGSFVGTVARGAPPNNPPAPRPHNVVFLLADDLGARDLGCYGADLHETPNIDRLAGGGIRFSQAYAMSVCSPTRAAILTGRHAARLHLTTWREASLTSLLKTRPFIMHLRYFLYVSR